MTPQAGPPDAASPRPPSAPVAAFDPGRNIGHALVARDGTPLRLRVLELAEVESLVLPDGAEVVVGSGTGGSDLVRLLTLRGFAVRTVDERGTTLLARDLWRERTRPRGLQRWMPAGLRAPPRPIDDYAAWAIALRHLGIVAPP